ncbi:MAG: phosphatase PAP2 family protein [Chloroflexota bacterium]
MNTFDFTVWMQTLFGPASRPFFEIITNLGSVPGLILIIGLAFWLKGTALGLRLLFITMLMGVVVEGLKVIIAQPRPYFFNEAVQPWRDSRGFGMPSGHAMGAMSLWGTLALNLRRYWFAIAAILIVLIGLSRIYFGVHSLPQVSIGWAMGVVLVWGLYRLEAPVVRWLRKQTLAIHLGLVVVVAVALFGYRILVVDQLGAKFVVPEQWTERYHQAQIYEASLDGETPEQLQNLPLFYVFGADQIGAFIGMMVFGIFVLHRGGFEHKVWPERMLNVFLGLIVIAGLIPILQRAEPIYALTLILYIILPMLVGWLVPTLSLRLLQLRSAT